MKIVTVVQARLGSTRLPGKVLRDLCGAPVLARQVERMLGARKIGRLVVAAPTSAQDDPIEQWCKQSGVECFRGHPTDLLARHLGVARMHNADVVVKIPLDCPLISPSIIDRVIGEFESARAKGERVDYVSNLHPATYPDGNDVEVMTRDALERAGERATRELEREHTTPYIWENPELFVIKNVTWETGLDYSMSHRWTLDYEADYQFLKAVFEALYPIRPDFDISDVLDLLERNPSIAEINAEYAGVNWYRNHLSELKTVQSHQTRQTPATKGTAV